MFEFAEVVFLKEGYFDHTPALLLCKPTLPSGKIVFRYFRMWKTHPKFIKIVEECWIKEVKGSKMFQVVMKLKSIKLALKKFNRKELSHIQEADTATFHRMDASQEEL